MMVLGDEVGRRRKAVFQGPKVEEVGRSFVEVLKNPIFAEDEARVEIDERECKSQFLMEFCQVGGGSRRLDPLVDGFFNITPNPK